MEFSFNVLISDVKPRVGFIFSTLQNELSRVPELCDIQVELSHLMKKFAVRMIQLIMMISEANQSSRFKVG